MGEEKRLKKVTYHLYTFLVSKLLGSLGANVYSFGLSMYVLSLTGSAFDFAMVILLSFVSRIVMSPISGLLGDRVPRKRLVIGGQLGVIASVTGLLVYTVSFELSLIAIYVVTVFNGLFSSITSVAFSASVANLVDQERLQKAMSFNQLAMSVAGISGPIVGGMLFGFVSMEVFLMIFIGLALVTLLLESTLDFNLYKVEMQGVMKKEESLKDSFAAGFRYVKTKPVLLAILWTALWLNLFFTAINVGGDFILVTKFGLDPKLIGLTEAGGAIGVMLAAIYFASRKNVSEPLTYVKKGTLGMAALVMAAGVPLLLSLPEWGNFVYYFVLMFLFGGLGVVTNTPIGVLMQTLVEDEYRGRVFGIVEMMSMSAMPIGTFMYGVLYDLVPAHYLLFTCGAIMIALIFVQLRPSVIARGHEDVQVNLQTS